VEVDTLTQTVRVTEASQPFAARTAVRDMARRAGFDDADEYRAGLVATELATNLVKHTTGGEVLLRLTQAEPAGEIEIVAIDRGPGMLDVDRCMVDGESTAGTSGNGLGAIRRLADDFDVHSDVGRGTAIVARLRAKRRQPKPPAFSFGTVSIPAPGEPVCGDSWRVRTSGDQFVVLVTDGLGHGVFAAEAADAAGGLFDDGPYRGPGDMLQLIHAAVRHTRGAAGAIAEIDSRRGVVVAAGVGNVATHISSPGVTRMGVSHNGTLGHQARAFREYTYPWTEDALVIMHSDGLTAHWSLDAYPGLRYRHPTLIAAILHRDCTRGRDDSTVVVVRKLPGVP
jgi:anti-sigma regulatory factor (Ser/Thr protein kinase)